MFAGSRGPQVYYLNYRQSHTHTHRQEFWECGTGMYVINHVSPVSMWPTGIFAFALSLGSRTQRGFCGDSLKLFEEKKGGNRGGGWVNRMFLNYIFALY